LITPKNRLPLPPQLAELTAAKYISSRWFTDSSLLLEWVYSYWKSLVIQQWNGSTGQVMLNYYQ
ncbi:hypothetical protein, partial [Aphanothece sacrum]|uniref:hypothetical protein n=1 Tax=Aphanothece sacrum TaxID=1122 RepID=UPI0015626A88